MNKPDFIALNVELLGGRQEVVVVNRSMIRIVTLGESGGVVVTLDNGHILRLTMAWTLMRIARLLGTIDEAVL